MVTDSGLGLGDVNLSALLSEDGGSDAAQQIPLTLIDVDAHQPRKPGNPGLSEASLKELAKTIEQRGVKSPISVREAGGGRYIINHGERRYKASLLAGKEHIPAFIDNDYTEVDQVIENIQREVLTAREIADFIGRQKSSGMSGKQIAELLGKSNAWVSQHAALNDLPECLADVFNCGRVTDVTLINELHKLWKKNPDDVEEWLVQEEDITRTSFKLFQEYLAEKNAAEGAEEPRDSVDDGARPVQDTSKATAKSEADVGKFKKAIVLVEYDGRDGRLMLTRRPEVPGCVWIKFDADGSEEEADAGLVKIRELIEG